MKPIIGIVTGFEYVPKGNFKKGVLEVNVDYVEMFKDKVVPLFIPYTIHKSEIKRLVDKIDGLLLIGGEDIDSRCYKDKKKIGSKRDLFEIEIYRCCKLEKKPILGICRGLQIINVAENGTLKDIDKTSIKHTLDEDGWVNHHEILITANTKLARIFNESKYPVSSVHHQKVDKLGDNLVVSGRALDGVIEAIESEDGSVIAFQGHIEKCVDNFSKYNDIIDYFIEEASNGKRRN